MSAAAPPIAQNSGARVDDFADAIHTETFRRQLWMVVPKVAPAKSEPTGIDRNLLATVIGLILAVVSIAGIVIGATNPQFDAINARLDRMDERFDRIEARLDSLEARVDRIETRLDSIDTRLDNLETRVSNLETRMAVQENKLDTIGKMIVLASGDGQLQASEMEMIWQQSAQEPVQQ